jgi:hypothetical protein
MDPEAIAVANDVVASEDWHVVPPRQINLTVCREQTMQPFPIEGRTVIGVLHQASQQRLLITRELVQRQPLGAREHVKVLVETLLHGRNLAFARRSIARGGSLGTAIRVRLATPRENQLHTPVRPTV